MNESAASVWDILDGTKDIAAPPSTAKAHTAQDATPEQTASRLWQHSQDLAMLRSTPPSYFVIPSGNQVTLPLMRWTFRGFSMALWTKLPVSQEGKKIRLFKFYSTSKSQGVECLLTPMSDDRVTLNVSSITDDKGWRHVSSQFQWTPDTWHFVVVCHRQHYLKRSHVICYVDGVRVMNDDLSFPAVMGPMVQCLIGGADINSVMGDSHISTMTMYEDELPVDAIAALFRYGPTQSCLRLIPTGANPFQHSLALSDSLCPLTTVDKSALYQQNSQVKVVFSLGAHAAFVPGDEAAGRLCVQWTSEGEFDDAGWTRLKMDAADVEFLPQRQVLLDDAVRIVQRPNRADDWFRHGGIMAIPVLLDQFLAANAMTLTLLTDALHVMQELLRSSVAHQEDMLHGFGFHLVSHVLRSHEAPMADLLTPSIATTCVELVLNLWPSNDKHSSMPLFAAGVHGLLLDFHLWTLAPYKTQSILIQQILLFATEHPRSLDVAIQAQHVVDILRTYYVAGPRQDPDASQWLAECVTSLVLLLNRSLAAGGDRDVVQIALDGGKAPPVRVPFRLVQDLRTICRFLVTSTDSALVTRAILNNLCEAFESDGAKRIACVAANVIEAVVHLVGPKHGWGVRFLAMRLFVLLFEWLEADAGRALLQTVEKQYQAEAVADPRLWNDLAHDGAFSMGLQHSIALNDVTNRSLEMPLSDQAPSPPSSATAPSRKDAKDTGKPPPSWWKLGAASNRLVLTFADRLLVLRSIALRQFQQGLAESSTDLQSALSAAVPWLIALPLRGMLPFVSVLFSTSSAVAPRDRDKILMEISVVVKTDKAVQTQLLDQPWVAWFADLLASSAPEATGEDLVLDTIVTLMCRALYNSQGYLCLDTLFAKFPSLPWRRRVLALIFMRTARNKTMLSRSVAENLYRLLMLATFLLIQDGRDHVEYLMAACLDITELLLESTHNKHRAGVIPGLRLCRLYLAHMPPPLPSRMLQLLATGLQQEVSQRMPIDESIQTQDMLVRVLSSLALAHAANPAVDCSELVLRIATCGLFDKTDELSVERLSAMDAASAARHVFSTLVHEPECLHFDEIVDWTLWMPKWFPLSASTPAAGGAKNAVVDAAAQVEEKRLWETLKEISKKESDRMASHDVGVDRRRQWTARSWDRRRHRVLTEQVAWASAPDGCIYPMQPRPLPPTRPHEYQLTRHEMPHPARRRHRIDVYFKPTVSTPAHPVAVISRDELEKVGRAIAKQGGAILDSPATPDDSADFDAAVQPPSPRQTDDDDDDDKVAIPSHLFAFVHPSSGRGVQPNERVYLQPTVRKVVPEGLVLGTLFICDHAAVFQPQVAPSPSEDVELAAGLQVTSRWMWKDVVAVYLRRFRLRESAIEIFVHDGTAHFLDFHVPDVASSAAARDECVRMILAMCPRATIKQWPMMSAGRIVGSLTKEWQMRLVTNYDYLMALNTLSGRSFNDLTQYPVFPWVLSNYTTDRLDLTDPANYRPLNQPVGALNPDRLAEYWERYHSFDDPVIPKFLYGSHYSTAAGSVLYYLMRLQPYASLHKLTQGGAFDLPDRLFNSVGDVWNMCNSSMSEVKELTPEWFTTPSFLRNVHQYEFGTRQDGVRIGDVELPPWARNDPEEFIRLHRAALESDYVSAHLHEWIDLIFGYQQRGPDALAANNVFYYLTYSGLVDLDSIDDPHLRNAMEQQIAHFGQCPQQLFRTPHPARGTPTRSLQEYPPHVTKSLSGTIGVTSLKVLSDRVLGVNAVGVIELHHWKLHKDGDKWLFKTERDTSPFDVVPRLPVYATSYFPVCFSSHGRVCVTGGAPTGTIHIRLIDLENGHVLARASADGHSGVVTCLAMDSLGEDEFFLSGSTDCSVMLWQLSQMNSPFRPPRVSSCPLMALRGHKQSVTACALSIPLGIAVSASDMTCLVHNVHTGAVSFGFACPPFSTFQSVAVSSKGYVIACAKINDTSVIKVYNLLGSCVRQHSMELCRSLQVSRDGSFLTATLPRSLRTFRLDDFSVETEYSNPKGHSHAISCAEIGPYEADMVAVTGHADGSLVWHVLPDADGQLSVVGSVGRFLNLNSKLKVVKGTVQQAQKLAISTIDNAQAVSNTAKDIADEAKSMMQTIFGLFK